MFGLLLSLLSWSGGTRAGSIDTTFGIGLGASGTVSGLVLQGDGKVLVAGDFSAFNGVPRNRVIRLNADGSVDLGFNVVLGPNGPVTDMAVQSDGRVLLVGDFSLVGGMPHSGVVRVDANGTVDAGFTANVSTNGSVLTVAVDGAGRVILGGDFDVVNGVARPNLARLQANGNLDAAFGAGVGLNGPVRALAVDANGRVLVGGDFTAAGGVGGSRLMRLNADGAVDANFNVGTGFDGDVEAITVQGDGRIVVGGSFGSVNGGPASAVVRLESDGRVDATFHPVLPDGSVVLDLALAANGDVVVGGQFNGVNGNAAIQNAARLNADGSLDAAFNADGSVQGRVENVAVQGDGSVVVGGSFTVTGELEQNLARLTAGEIGGTTPVITHQPTNQTVTAGANVTFAVEAEGTAPLSFQWLRNGVVLGGATSATLSLNAVSSADAGDYSVVVSNAVGVAVSGVARLDVASAGGEGTVDATFQAAGTVGVNDLEIESDGEVVVGGAVDLVGNLLGRGLLRLTGDGGLDLTFQVGGGANGEVHAVEGQADGKIVLGGEFTVVNGTNQNRVVRLNADGSVDTSFAVGTGANDTVLDVDVQGDGKIVVVGEFTTVNSSNRQFVARLNVDGTVDGSFKAEPGPNGAVGTVAVQGDGRVLIGGSFSAVNGTNAPGLARLNMDGSIDVDFAAALNDGATVETIEVQVDGKILVGGELTAGTGSGRNLVRLSADGSLDASFNAGAGPNDSVLAIAAQGDGRVVMGGEFTTAGGVPRRFIARLNADGSVDANFDAGAAIPSPVKDLELQSDGKIIAAGEFGIIRLNAEVGGPLLFGAARGEGNFGLSLQTESGKGYVLEYSASLSNANWVQVSTIAGDGSVRTLTDANAKGSVGFYRVRVE